MKKFILYGLATLGALSIVAMLIGVGVLASHIGTSRASDAMSEMSIASASPAAPPMSEAEADEGAMGKKSAPAGPARHRSAKAGGGPMGLVSLGSVGGADGRGKGVLASLADKKEKKKSEADGETESGTPSRSWFPETFLFDPLVVTDAQGHATVSARVPDRLTTWRVLALAYARNGAQAGTVTTFDGTLPAYVDPIVPHELNQGDVVQLPIQIVNTTDQPLSTTLTVDAAGAKVDSKPVHVLLAPHGSTLQMVTVHSDSPGSASLRARLEGSDAVVRAFEIAPAGRPISVRTGGTLAAPRELKLALDDDALSGSGRARLVVFPGALSVVRSELSAASSRDGIEEDAYALLLAGRAPALLAALGATPDAELVRQITLVLGQRALRWGRTAGPIQSTVLAEAALAHPESPMLARLGERLVANVARSQRPDGTCQAQSGWRVQRLLVSTADCLRAITAANGTAEGKRRASLALARAEGAFERLGPQIDDGYTAAAVLASGAVKGPSADHLRELLVKSLSRRSDGAQVLHVDAEVVRSDGRRPSEIEATALAVLALDGVPNAPLPDLGAAVLSGYVPGEGWGDGRANWVGLQAVSRLFRERVPSQVHVTLEEDGKPIAQGLVDPSATQDAVAIEGPMVEVGGRHVWRVKAEPAVAGLGFSLTLSGRAPWKTESGEGLELKVTAPAAVKVGQPVLVRLDAAGPADVPLHIRQPLPAGVQVERTSLDGLVSAGTLSSYSAEDGELSFDVPALQPGQTFSANVRMVATLGGTLHASAASIEPTGQPGRAKYVPTVPWAVH